MTTCATCGRGLHDARTLWTTCQDCQARIEAHLDETEQLWPLLSDCLVPARGAAGPRVSGATATAPLPASATVLDLIGPAGVPTRLYWRYADLAVGRRLQPAPAPAGSDARLAIALRGIRRHLPWAVQAVDLTDLAAELAAVVGEMRHTTGGTVPRTDLALPCPALFGDGTACGGVLRYHREQRTVTCSSCGTVHDPAALLDLAAT